MRNKLCSMRYCDCIFIYVIRHAVMHHSSTLFSEELTPETIYIYVCEK
jgi:hypothetical protein